jgi:nucleoside-diphosphate-sugar epimerase
VIHEVSGPESLNTSARQFYDTVLVKDSKTEEVLSTQGSCWADVRDIAEGHVRALEKEAAGGERIVISAGMSLVEEKSETRLKFKIFRTICLARLE